jgi:hypothetical protein
LRGYILYQKWRWALSTEFGKLGLVGVSQKVQTLAQARLPAFAAALSVFSHRVVPVFSPFAPP